MILFSIIIPHYNSVALLERLLTTIPIDETIQVIVIDDKSTDDVSDIEQQVTARGGVFIHNTTERKGAGTARNLGLREAKGKWLIFADADDFFTKGAFDILNKYADAKEDIVYFIPTSIYENTGKTAGRHLYYKEILSKYMDNPSKINEAAVRYKLGSPWSKIIRRQIIDRNGILFDEIPAANDVMFSMRSAYVAKTIQVSDKTIYCITQSLGTLTTKKSEKNFLARVDVFIDRYFFIKEKLDTNRFGLWDLSGIGILKRAFREGYSTGFIIKCCGRLMQKRVPFISVKGLINSIRLHIGGKAN